MAAMWSHLVFFIISDQADRLLDCWYLSPFQYPPDDVIIIIFYPEV